jgi:hypothetical protein
VSVAACASRSQVCKITDWGDAEALKDSFGARVFLIENLEIASIVGRRMFDFVSPDTDLIPDIAVLQSAEGSDAGSN